MFEVFEYARKVSNVESQVRLHSLQIDAISACVLYISTWQGETFINQ